jgi:two-component system CitB family sensor kinase
MRRLRRRLLSSQIFVFQALMLAGTLLVGFLLALYGARNRFDEEYQERALGVARSVAATPEIARAVAREDRSGEVQRRAERVRPSTGM